MSDGIPEPAADEPRREDIDRMPGPVLLEFGTAWCGHCQALAPYLATQLEEYPEVRHVKVEDGPGKPLGRSFRVKLWPTLVFLRDGREIDRVVRPRSAAEVADALAGIAGPAQE